MPGCEACLERTSLVPLRLRSLGDVWPLGEGSQEKLEQLTGRRDDDRESLHLQPGLPLGREGYGSLGRAWLMRGARTRG